MEKKKKVSFQVETTLFPEFEDEVEKELMSQLSPEERQQVELEKLEYRKAEHQDGQTQSQLFTESCMDNPESKVYLKVSQEDRRN